MGKKEREWEREEEGKSNWKPNSPSLPPKCQHTPLRACLSPSMSLASVPPDKESGE